jgi:hypothetical protein
MAVQRAAAARLGAHDRAILAMRLAGTAERDIAATVWLRPPAAARLVRPHRRRPTRLRRRAVRAYTGVLRRRRVGPTRFG